VLIHPAMVAGRLGTKWFEWGTRRALGLIERISGIGFLSDVSEFLMAFEHMSEGFRARAKEVRSLLLGPQAAFVLVASPETESVKAAQGFLARLESSNVRVAGIVANRVRVWPGAGAAPAFEDADPAPLARALGDPRAARAAIDAAARYAALVRRDALALDALRERAERRGGFFRVVPELRGDVHDLSTLHQVADALAHEPARRDDGKGATMAAAPDRRLRVEVGVARPDRDAAPESRSTRRSRARAATRRARSRRRSRRCARCSTPPRSRPRARPPRRIRCSQRSTVVRAREPRLRRRGRARRRHRAEIAEALDAEIARWEERAKHDADARSVLRAFLGLREVLWELGVRASFAQRAEGERRPSGGHARADDARSRSTEPAASRPRVQRVAVQG
jgi:hypothetical protein